METSMDTREVLRPYKKQRLGFEGVLINIIEPNRRNGYQYGLVFGSVYAPNENIELDHVVIQIDKKSLKEIGIELFKRYYFTAQIEMYYKTAFFLGIAAVQENFMLTDIRPHKIQEIDESKLTQPTMYVMTRVNNIMLCKTTELQHTEQELLDIIFSLPNDGSIERFINEYTQSLQHQMSKNDVINALYS